MEWIKEVGQSAYKLTDTPFRVIYHYGNQAQLFESESDEPLLCASLEECMKHAEFLSTLSELEYKDLLNFVHIWKQRNLDTDDLMEDPSYLVERVFSKIRNINKQMDWQDLREFLYILLVSAYLEGREESGQISPEIDPC